VALALRLTWLGRPREADPMLPYRAKSITEPKETILLPIALPCPPRAGSPPKRTLKRWLRA